MSERSYPVGGYAPGLYESECSSCGVVFIGDKRAYQCLDCVALDQKEEITRLRAELAESQKWEAVFRQYFDDSQDGMECLPGCDSIAHDDDCPVVNPMAAFRKLRAKLAEEEIELEKAITERDHWEDKATELANDIGEALGFGVGEHSNLNCPVQTAIDGVAEMRSQINEWSKLAEAEGQEPVAYQNPMVSGRIKLAIHITPRQIREGWEPLYTHPAPAKVPEGFALVPIEPTNEMLSCIAHEEFPEDWNAGKELQAKQINEDRPYVPPRTEYEIAVGKYNRLLNAAKQEGK